MFTDLWSLIIRPILKELESLSTKISSAIFWDAKVVNELLTFFKLDEIQIHINKNLIKGAYDRNEKYVKIPENENLKNIWIKSAF